jgi:hypothetical protein
MPLILVGGTWVASRLITSASSLSEGPLTGSTSNEALIGSQESSTTTRWKTDRLLEGSV